MRTILALLTGMLLSASLAHAQPGAPTGPPPAFKIVTSVDKDKGMIVFKETVYRHVPVSKEIVMIVNGQQVKKTVTEYVAVAEERLFEINAANSRIITPDGKQLPIDEVWMRVKAKSVVVVSATSDATAQAYLRALSAETLVIIPAAPKNEPIPQPKKE